MTLFDKLLNHIQKEEFDEVENLLSSYIYEVEDQMEELSEEEFLKLEPHWSAVNTGDGINTPVFVLKKIFDFIKFKDSSKIIDLGSGHGHPGLVFGALKPDLNIIGYDIVKEKVKGANQVVKELGLENVLFKVQDLSELSFDLPEADYYYFFNPVNREVVEVLANKIIEVAKTKKVKVISLSERELKVFKNKSFKMSSELPEIGLQILEHSIN